MALEPNFVSARTIKRHHHHLSLSFSPPQKGKKTEVEHPLMHMQLLGRITHACTPHQTSTAITISHLLVYEYMRRIGDLTIS
jgi:hypothetical protein